MKKISNIDNQVTYENIDIYSKEMAQLISVVSYACIFDDKQKSMDPQDQTSLTFLSQLHQWRQFFQQFHANQGIQRFQQSNFSPVNVTTLLNNKMEIENTKQQNFCTKSEQDFKKLQIRNNLDLTSKKKESKPKQRQKQKDTNLNESEAISYFVFLTKLKQLFQFSHKLVRIRLYAWMYLYIQLSNPDSDVKNDQLKKYHRQNLQFYHNVEGILAHAHQSKLIQSQFFQDRMQNFEKLFPQVHAVFQYFAINNFEENYDQSCQIAKEFFSKLKIPHIKQPQKLKRYEWTRYQYLTYTAFICIKRDLVIFFIKYQFDDLAEYSFGGDIEKIWNIHANFWRERNYKSWQPLHLDLVKKWKFTSEIVQSEKEKLAPFLKQKQMEREQYIEKQSTFERFLAQRKMKDLKNKCQISTDCFQLESKTFKYFFFGQQKQFRQHQKQKNQKKYSIYMVAEFQLSPQQKIQLENLRKQLNQLMAQIQESQDNQNIELKAKQSNKRSKDEERSVMDSKQRKYVRSNAQRTDNLIELQRGSKNQYFKDPIKKARTEQQNLTQIELESRQLYPYHNFHREKSNTTSLQGKIKNDQHFNPDQKAQQSQFLEDQTQQVQFPQQQLIKDKESFKISQQSNGDSFGTNQQKDLSNNQLHQNQIEFKQKISISHLPSIKEQRRVETSQSDSQSQSDQENVNNQHSKQGNQKKSEINQISVQDFLRTIISDEEYQKIKQIFRRKTFEFMLMSFFVRHEQKSKGSAKSQQYKTIWTFKENVKFVSFLIVNKFAFYQKDVKEVPAYTSCVLSEFIQSRNPLQCTNHYQQFTCSKLSIDEIIIHLIKKFQIQLSLIEKQVNQQKRRYFQVKGSIFQIGSRIRVLRQTNQTQKSIQDNLVEKLQEKPLVFNLKTDYLTSSNQRRQVLQKYEAMAKRISLPQKERYLKCLEMSFQNKRLNKAKLMQFALEIFKERNALEKIPLLEEYHKVMMMRHRQVQQILTRETKIKDGTVEVGKSKAEIQKQRNLKFLVNFCQRIQNSDDGVIQVEFFQQLWDKPSPEEC